MIGRVYGVSPLTKRPQCHRDQFENFCIFRRCDFTTHATEVNGFIMNPQSTSFTTIALLGVLSWESATKTEYNPASDAHEPEQTIPSITSPAPLPMFYTTGLCHVNSIR